MTTIIFDTETTGVKEPRLVEAAWHEIKGPPFPLLNPVGTFCSRYNPGKPIECGAMATHHIMDQDVADCAPATKFRLPEDTDYLIGHNVDFDYRVAVSCGPQPTPKRICMLALCRSLWPEADSHSLAAMCYRLEPSIARGLCPGAHGALRDIQLVGVVLDCILRRLNFSEKSTWEDLWQASERARVPTIMPFGKHKGKLIEDLPRDYKHWLLGQPDVDAYLVLALRR